MRAQDIGGGCLIWRGDPPMLDIDTGTDGGRGDVRAACDPELSEHGGHMVVDGPRRQEQVRCDPAVREARGDEPEHLDLACREASRIRPRRRAGPSRNGSYAQLAKARRRGIGGRPSAEQIEGRMALEDIRGIV